MTDSFDDTQEMFELNVDQKKVLNMIGKLGSNSLRVRDRASKSGVERPLDIINELYELGFIGKKKGFRNALILTRIR